MSPNSESFPQIKRDLVNEVQAIGVHLQNESLQREEVRVLLGKLSLFVFGDVTANPPIKGMNDRLEKLEEEKLLRVKARQENIDWAKKTATGAITLAVGSAVIWVFKVISEAFVKAGGH